MTEYLVQIVKAIVEQPEQVEITRQAQGQTLLFQVKVAPEDAGKVIGKEGRVINALRMLVKAGAGRRFTRANIEILA
jgi:hypothetical protein